MFDLSRNPEGDNVGHPLSLSGKSRTFLVEEAYQNRVNTVKDFEGLLQWALWNVINWLIGQIRRRTPLKRRLIACWDEIDPPLGLYDPCRYSIACHLTSISGQHCLGRKYILFLICLGHYSIPFHLQGNNWITYYKFYQLNLPRKQLERRNVSGDLGTGQ